MIPASRALALVMKHTARLPAEMAPVSAAAGRVLAHDLRAREDLPPFDNSAMDGYAVRLADLRGASPRRPVDLKRRPTVRAGSGRLARIKPGEAVKIMTGAPVPPGTGAVVMQEETAEGPGRAIRFFGCPKRGENVRLAGEDVRRGERILGRDVKLRPFEVALLAAQGFASVPVSRRPRTAVLATGDELVKAGGRLSFGRIRNSNGPALISALSGWRIPALDGGIVRDRRRDIERRVSYLLARADVLLVSGGVSVGEFDLCREVFAGIGVRQIFWKVAIKPGKPLYFGTYRRRLIFGLPGNPVSALVCLGEFVRPALEKMQGFRLEHAGFHLQGRLGQGYSKPSDRQRYLFCRARQTRSGYRIEVVRPQGSAMVRNACRANALAVSPQTGCSLRAGERLSFRWLK